MARSTRKRASGIGVDELKRVLASAGADPVYLISGADDYLREEALRALTRSVGGDETEASTLAVERIDGRVASLSQVLDAARSLPLFLGLGERPTRLLWVDDFDATAIDDAGPLEEYLADPVEGTCLAFEAAKLDARRTAVKLLRERATWVECDPPQTDAELASLIRRAAEGRGYRIGPDAVALLVEMVGPDLQQLHQEMEKVSLYVGDRDTIEARDLEQLLGRSREHSVFELTDALVRGDAGTALRTLNWLLDDGEEPLRVFAMVCWICRELVKARDLASRRVPERQALQQLGGRWEQRKKLLARVRGGGDLEPLLVLCAEADRAIKTGRGAAVRGALESLCRRLCAA